VADVVVDAARRRKVVGGDEPNSHFGLRVPAPVMESRPKFCAGRAIAPGDAG
jgi:hypothetical protein